MIILWYEVEGKKKSFAQKATKLDADNRERREKIRARERNENPFVCLMRAGKKQKEKKINRMKRKEEKKMK